MSIVEKLQTITLAINGILFLLIVLGGWKVVIKQGFSINEALREVKEIKLVVNEHTEQLAELERHNAYEEGIRKGKELRGKKATGEA